MSELARFLSSHPETEVVEVLFTDLSGVLRGKQVPVGDLDKLYAGQLVLPRASILLDTLGDASETIPYGIRDGDPDRALLPVPGTLAPMSWAPRPSAQVLTVMSDARDTPWFANPRSVLQGVLDRVTAAGFTPVLAIELEFHLLDIHPPEPGIDAGAVPAPRPARGTGNFPPFIGPQTYNLDHLHDYRHLVMAIETACAAQQLPIGSVFSEYGDGQFEINLAHSDQVATACDQAVLLRRLVRRVASEHDCLASFMAHPLEGNTGNGLHVHLSLLDRDGHNVFSRETAQCTSPGLESLSDIALQAVRGMQCLMPDSMALFAPNANSYHRLQPGSFAPTVADWGLDHRAVALRIPHARGRNTRIEHRVAGADANPYLVVAAMLAGLLHGLAGGETARLPTTGTDAAEAGVAAEPLPTRWNTAIDRFADNAVLAELLGTEFCALYTQVKREEEARYHAALGSFDRQRYLRVI